MDEAYFGKGKGKGKGFRKNPNGADGKPLKCSICGSDTHLRRWCPQAGKSGHPSGKPPMGTMYAQTAGFAVPAEEAGNAAGDPKSGLDATASPFVPAAMRKQARQQQTR